MEWNETAAPVKTDLTTATLDFELPLDVSVTFDWSAFDSASSNIAQPESNDEMQRLLDTYTWNSIQV